MSFGSSRLITILLSLALGASLFKVRDLSHQNTELTQTAQDTQARYEILESQMLKAHVKEQTVLMSQQDQVELLQRKVKAQADTVSIAEDRLHREQNVTTGKHIPGLRDQLDSEKAVIQDLQARLKEDRDRQVALRGQDKYYQEQAGTAQKQTDEQLKEQVIEQEKTLKEMNDQMKQFKRYNPYDPMGQGQQIQELQAKINIQRNTVQQLKDQRNTSNYQWGYQKAQTRNQNQVDLASLKTNEEELLAQIQRETAAYQSLEKDINSGVQTQKSRDALVQGAAADLSNQKAKLTDLQSQLTDAQDRLKSITPAQAQQ